MALDNGKHDPAFHQYVYLSAYCSVGAIASIRNIISIPSLVLSGHIGRANDLEVLCYIVEAGVANFVLKHRHVYEINGH